MIWVQCSIVKKSLMLSHSEVEWNIIIFHPSTKWMQQEEWVLVTSSNELLSGVLKQEAMAIVEWVSDLESVNCISSSFGRDLVDLGWGHSVLIHAVVEFEFGGELHGLSGNEVISLLPDSADLWVIERCGTEGLGTDFFLTVVKEFWLVDDGDDIVTPFQCNSLLAFKLCFLFRCNMLSDWHRQYMLLTIFIGDCVHV